MTGHRILFVTEAGADSGHGHLVRMISLAGALAEAGAVPYFAVHGDDSVVGMLDGLHADIFDWQSEADRLMKLAMLCEAAVIDSYRMEPSQYDSLAAIVSTPCYIDDNRRIEYPEGIIVNPSLGAEDFLYPGDHYVLAGSRFALLRDEFTDVPRRETADTIGSILITFGAADPGDMTAAALREIVRAFPGVEKTVIVGPAQTRRDAVVEAADATTDILAGVDAAGMKKAMMQADVAVSAAGQTMHELARTGVPTVAVQAAANQAHNLAAWSNTGFCFNAGDAADPGTPGRIIAAVSRLENPDVRRQMSKVGQALVDGRGAERVAGAIMKSIKQMKPIRGTR